MKCAVYVAVLAALVGSSLQAALKLPAYIKTCSKNDPDFNGCALKSAVAALPSLFKGDAKYRIPVLDPFHVEHVDITQGSGPVKIDLALDDIDLKGLKHLQIRSLNIDLNKQEIAVGIFVKDQDLTIDSKYKIKGQVLILPINGEGNMNLKIENAEGMFKCGFDLVKKDGKEYVQIRDSTLDFSVTKSIFDFKNLFNGDKVLGDNMNKFLNENWQEVFTEVKPVVSETMRTIVINIIDKLTTIVPYEDIFTA